MEIWTPYKKADGLLFFLGHISPNWIWESDLYSEFLLFWLGMIAVDKVSAQKHI